MSTKHLLNECFNTTKKLTGITPFGRQGIQQLVCNPSAYKTYVRGLAEGLEGDDREVFFRLAESTRQQFLRENSVTQINSFESLTLPILRVFYPKLIAKELVNVMPIDKPDVIQGFVKPSFGRFGDSGHPYAFPSINQDISRGPGSTIQSPGSADVGSTENIFAQIGSGLSSENAHIERDFYICKAYDATSAAVALNVRADIDGNFSIPVTINGHADVVSGHIDYEYGTMVCSSLNGVVKKLDYVAYASLEENKINPTTRYEIEKIEFRVVGRRITAEWSIDMEQDVKALYDIQLQSDLVNIIAEQIAVDVDREIVNKLIAANSAMNPASHTKTFDLKPPTGFAWGRKQWYENIQVVLSNLSAQIYQTSFIGAANTIACNPLDAAIFESLNTFEYTGNSVDGGDVGYKSATVQGGRWKILVSQIVPKGNMIVKYRSNDLSRAAFVYAPYVPAMLMPYPMQANPTMTVMTRYATKVIRNEALGALKIVDTETGYPNV